VFGALRDGFKGLEYFGLLVTNPLRLVADDNIGLVWEVFCVTYVASVRHDVDVDGVGGSTTPESVAGLLVMLTFTPTVDHKRSSSHKGRIETPEPTGYVIFPSTYRIFGA
jgi:hypothetical protein